MTTTRCVRTSFALAAVAVFVLTACGASGPPSGTPEALYVDLGCAKCHGAERQGQKSGPPLIAIGDHWQEENPRLKYMAEDFPIMMPAYADTNEEDLRKLAKYILES
jgi:cytochrome c553